MSPIKKYLDAQLTIIITFDSLMRFNLFLRVQLNTI